jgi:GT2 family glycosyltransferase
MPLGNCTELGLFVNMFGDANFIVRRSVFEALMGFSVRRPRYQYIGFEDYEFLARLSLAGYRLDVIPEFLLHYRHRSDSLLRTSAGYQTSRRVLDGYREKLSQVGLPHLLPLLYGLYLRAGERPNAVPYSDPAWIATHVPWYNLRDALFAKVKKHLRRLPHVGKYVR